MDGKPNKKQKAELRRLAGMAYERELGRELERLQGRFDDWRGGTLSASELGDHVRRFHRGPAREVQGRYDALKKPACQTAWALASGTLEESEVDPELLELLRERVDAYRSLTRSE
jgi:hypothetical protein